MTVKELIKSMNACLTCKYGCNECSFFNCDKQYRCQDLLANAIEEKFNELVELLDDKVNHHYYDILEFYQEENDKLREKFEEIKSILDN